MSNWEPLLILLSIGAVLYFFGPRLLRTIKESEKVEANWGAVLVPLVALIAFVFLLIYIARN